MTSLANDVVAWHAVSPYLTPWNRGPNPEMFIMGAVAIWLPACVPAWYYRQEPRWRQYLITALLALLLRVGPCALMRASISH